MQPLSQSLSVSVPGSALATQIARCKRCGAYINPYVVLRDRDWVCVHCDSGAVSLWIFLVSPRSLLLPLDNSFQGDRYNASLRSTLPELSNNAVDYLVHEPTDDVDLTHFPVFLMIVDISGPSMKT